MERVIEEMAKAKSDVERRLRQYIPEIIRECMAFAYLGKTFTFDVSDLSDRVNRKLISLSDEILDDIEARAKTAIKYAEDEEDEDAILLYINRQIGEEDMITRIDKHCSTLRYFLEGWIAIGLTNNLKEYELTNQILSFIDNPFASPLWQEAFNAGYLSDAIRSHGYSYGKGNQRNILSALTEIGRYAINEAYQYGRVIRYKHNGAIGYVIHRGSSFDCPYCDSYCGVVHPLTEYLLPLHPRCMCYSTPVYREDASDWRVMPLNTGAISIHKEVNKKDSDYKDLLNIAKSFASKGSVVFIPPKKSWGSSFDYDAIYGSLKGTRFYGKCPDINIDGKWYEFESFSTSNKKNAFRNMMNHGLKQSNRIIIKDPGLERGYIKKSIHKRINMDGQDIEEVWIKELNDLVNVYKKKLER